MTTEILYKRADFPDPIHFVYLRESPKEVLHAMYKKNDIYKYKSILAPTDSRLENRLSGFIIRESNMPANARLKDICELFNKPREEKQDDVYFDAVQDAIEHYLIKDICELFNKPREEKQDDVYFDAVQDAIEHYLMVAPTGRQSKINYLDAREFQHNEFRENAMHDIIEIMEVTLQAAGVSVKDLRFIAEHP